jgi:hypothetical protein
MDMTTDNKPGFFYRAGNIALDLATLGVFTARYKRGWPNAWRSDGCSCMPGPNDDGTHKEHCTVGQAQRQASMK